ncbi:hypothetical protein AAEX28_04725 [Lentisphaerota bacterium WC36G]|nr:hypothetical protein LJT99_07585 [Lentisphaerae bacterium WC36]
MCIFTGLIASLGTAIGIGASATAATGASVGAAATGIGMGGAVTGLGGAAFGTAAATATTTGIGAGTMSLVTGITGVVGSLTSAGVGAYGAYSASQQQAEFYKMQNQALAQNSAILDTQKANAKERAIQDQRLLYNDYQQTKGTARATMSANNVVLGHGSSLDFESDLDFRYLADKQNMLYNQAMEQWQIEANKTNIGNQMNINSYAADASRNAGTLNIFGNAIKGMTSAASGSFDTFKGYQSTQGKRLFQF